MRVALVCAGLQLMQVQHMPAVDVSAAVLSQVVIRKCLLRADVQADAVELDVWNAAQMPGATILVMPPVCLAYGSMLA